ncbi:MAG: L,D-transpeptidase [Pseudomonadota bacterium]
MFRSHRSSGSRGWRRLLIFGTGVLLLAGGLGAAWMVHVAKSSTQPAAAPQSTTVATLSPSAETPAGAKTLEPQTPPPAPAVTGQGASPGGELFFCYQGKAPDTRLLVVDKARQRLMVLRYLGDMSLDYEYTCATGMQPGSKQSEGDERTPEGIYFTTHRYEDRKVTVFGDRAIHLNYPNPFDQFESRDGNGIFIHGTDKTLKPRSSNGCVVLRNEELAVVASTIKEHFTPVVVVDQLRLPALNDRVKACGYLEKLSLTALEEAEAAVGYSLDTKSRVASKPSQMKELDELAARLAGLGTNTPQVRVQTQGLALFGLGQQWVVVADQRISGPNRAELQISRRFYLRGADPLHARLLSSHWVVEDASQARLLASWAPEPKPAPVQVASTQPTPTHAEPERRQQAPPVKAAATPEDQVRAMLAGWVKAWQGKHMSEYIGYYAPEFSGDGMNRNAWQKHKTYLSKVYKVIGVEARDVRVTVLGSKAKVAFVQHYRSDWHRDVGRKHLDLVLKGGHWKITAERWEALPGRAAHGGRGGRS